MINRFDKLDWNEFNGAEKFKNGSEPFIFRSEKDVDGIIIGVTLVGDVNGIEICVYGGEEDEENIWTEEFKNATPNRIEGVMRHIIKALNLDGDWYAPDVTYALDHAFNGISNI